MTKKQFAKEQPKDGETIMHCGHLERGRMHWYQYEEPLKFQRLDGTRGQARWFAACDLCVSRHGEKVTRFVRGDDTWIGDEPVIEETVES